jgi:hypothetical protein
MTNEDLKAKTSDGVPFYTKIDFGFLKELAETLTIGTYRYDRHVMVENWRLGDSPFFYKRANHAVEHIFKWLSGDRTENHLTHAAANLMMLHWAEKQGIFDPTAPEISAMQWVAFVRANQEKKDEVTSPPVVKEETKNKVSSQQKATESISYHQGVPMEDIYKVAEMVGNGQLPKGSGLYPDGRVDDLTSPIDVAIDALPNGPVSHVLPNGKPVINVAKATEILLG